MKYPNSLSNGTHLALLLLAPVFVAGCSDSGPSGQGTSTAGTISAGAEAGSPADVARRDLAAALFAEDRFEDCLETLRPLFERKSPTEWDLNSAGIAASNLDDPDLARGFFERALKANPNSAVAHFNLGQLDFPEDELESSAAHYQRAHELAPGDVPTELALANVLVELDRLEEADAHYAALQKVGLEFSGSWYISILYRRGQMKFSEGLDEEGLALIQESEVLRARGITAPNNTDIRRGNFGRVLPPSPLAQATAKALPLGTFAPPVALGFDPAHELTGLLAVGLKEYWKSGSEEAGSNQVGTTDWIGWGPGGVFALSGDTDVRLSAAGAERVLGLDIEDDGDLDLLVLSGNRVDLLLKQPAGFEPKLAFELPSPPRDALLVDFDHEGDLDLLVVGDFGVRLLRNDGAHLPDGALTDATAEAGLLTERALDWCIAEDFDTDQDVDFLFGGAGGVQLADDERGGLFAWRDERTRGLPIGTRPLVADLDSDGRPDLIFGDGGTYLVRADGSYKKRADGATGRPLALLGDLDGNGNTDGLGRGEGGQLLWYPGLASSQPLDLGSAADGPAFERFGALIDTDGNGAEDLVFLSGGQAYVQLRTPIPSHTGFRLFLHGIKDNRRAVGAIVELRSGEAYRRIYWRHGDQRLGLGGRQQAEVLRVTWPNGVVQNVLAHAAGQDLVVDQKEGLIGSCPFLYAWDGERYTFISDVLGITPLGLPMAPGMLVPPDHDEFVLVTGEQLRPHATDGGSYYDLQFTEELREVTYLDKARLLVVDHPLGTEIFPDERFCFPPFPGSHTHVTEAPRGPLSAREVDLSTGLATGRDWAPEMAAIDGDFAAPFEHYHGRFQGLAKPHIVEFAFDPADVASAEKLRLFMTGWFYWTNASVNMAAAREPGVDFVPPIFSVPDGSGGWRELGPPFGFPAGKTKTMVVDLTGQLDPADPRLRVFSTLRLYWDAVRLGTDGDDAPMITTELEPVSALLWERGFSRPVPLMGDHELEWFDWDQLESTPRWNQHPGSYTKLGEVLPLLDEAEDQFVILGSGDALRLRFDATQAPPLKPGYRRDFLVYLDGWAKDRDPNSIAVEFVEPMPFHAMSGFPYGPDESFPNSAAHKAWRKEWNTRDSKSWIEPLATKR